MIHLSEDDVRRLLPMRDAIAQVRLAFESLVAGSAINQPRRRLFVPQGSVLHLMAACCGPYFGAKIYSTNVKKGAAHFHFLLYDSATAEPLALMEANSLGRIRTGAASGLATGLMAPPEVESVALLGSGFQAWTQLEAVLAVRNPRQVRVFSRSEEKRTDFAARAAGAFNVDVRAADSAEQAVRGADIIITATYAKDPVLEDAWVRPCAHINAAGSNQAARRELPAGLVRRAALIAVDSLEQARIEAGDLLLALPENEWDTLPLVELQALVAAKEFRRPDGITIFESLGLAVEDVAAAALVYERATLAPPAEYPRPATR
jgi:ornithine cyclodeaminase/alanine dehydrogenase-like protein (mu-crystallin family)